MFLTIISSYKISIPYLLTSTRYGPLNVAPNDSAEILLAPYTKYAVKIPRRDTTVDRAASHNKNDGASRYIRAASTVGVFKKLSSQWPDGRFATPATTA